MRRKSEVHKLNQAKLGLVKFRQSYWSNFHIVLRSDELMCPKQKYNKLKSKFLIFEIIFLPIGMLV